MSRVLVLGHRGMLGHVVHRRLAELGHEVLLWPERLLPATLDQSLADIQRLEPDAIVNAVAQLGPAAATTLGEWTNGVLPGRLATSCRLPARFIQASTDGVFSPEIPNRTVHDTPDALDRYGQAKAKAESEVLQAGGTVVRCSVIGPELGPGRSLMGWLARQRGSVTGFRNQFWNGLTTLAWADLCHAWLLAEPTLPKALIQPGFVPAVSKAELLAEIARTSSLPVTVTPADAPQRILRTLTPNWTVPPIPDQLARLQAWYGSFSS